jgi:hypothetical protein
VRAGLGPAGEAAEVTSRRRLPEIGSAPGRVRLGSDHLRRQLKKIRKEQNMKVLRLSGIALISGFIVLVVFGFIFTPPNLYQERDIDVRMQIVDDYRSQFVTAQIATGVGAASIAVGYLLLTLHLQRDKSTKLANFGAAAMLIGAIFLAILMLQGISDPRAYLERNSMKGSVLSIYDHGFTWLTIAGYLFYGIELLRANFPRWLAIFTLGFTALVLIAALFIEKAAVELLFLIPLVVGIVVLRLSKRK